METPWSLSNQTHSIGTTSDTLPADTRVPDRMQKSRSWAKPREKP